MRRLYGIPCALAALIAAGVPGSALAYVATLTQQGTSIRWAGAPRLNLAGNSNNRSNLNSSDLFAMVTRGLQRWKEATGGFIQFDYWQGSDNGVYEPNNSYNGLSSLYFASNSSTTLDPNVLGFTQVWYDSGSGQILEADIVFNDNNYRFTSRAEDHSGVFFENVLTHELGHAFGLSHSGTLQSTMLYLEADEQNHLSCDEWAGVHSVYGIASGQTGMISGDVTSAAGTAAFGAHVVAVSSARGVILGSALTDRSGHFVIRSLEPGSYYLFVEPYYAGASTLSDYYSSSSSRLCGSNYFSRTFLLDSSGFSLAPIQVGTSANANVGTITLRCGSGAAVTAHAGATLQTAAQIPDSQSFGVADRVQGNGLSYYKLHLSAGTLELHAVAYSAYSPIRARLRLLDRLGNEVSAVSQNPVSTGRSGFSNYDSSLVAENLMAGDYFVEINSNFLASGYYPAPASIDSVPFLILTGSVNPPQPVLAEVLPINSKCAQPESFGSYTSPGGTPPRSSTSSTKESDTGFCGTIQKVGGGGGTPTAPMSILGWSLPWLVMAGFAQWVRLRLRISRRVVTL